LDNGSIVYAGHAADLAADEHRIQTVAGASSEAWSIDAPAA
jgi:hypothetical protein